jgi:hypothetical protein
MMPREHGMSTNGRFARAAIIIGHVSALVMSSGPIRAADTDDLGLPWLVVDLGHSDYVSCVCFATTLRPYVGGLFAFLGGNTAPGQMSAHRTRGAPTAAGSKALLPVTQAAPGKPDRCKCALLGKHLSLTYNQNDVASCIRFSSLDEFATLARWRWTV